MEADSASEPPGSLPFESARIAGRRSVLDLWADDDDDSRQQAGQATLPDPGTREGMPHGVGRKGGDDVRRFRGCEAGRVRTRGMGERRWKALRSTEDPSLDEPTAAAVESGRRRLHVQSTKRNLTSSFSRHHFNPRLLLRPPNTDCFNMRTSSETILLALALVATAVKAELKVEVYDGPKECEDHQRVQIGNYLSMVNIYLLRRNSFCLIRKKKI